MSQRILVTGSRDWSDRDAVFHWLSTIADIGAVIVHGDCSTGADAHAAEWADLQPDVTPEEHPADWEGPCRDTCKPGHRRNGRCPAAGPYRNQDMVDLGADICLAFPLPGSRGTNDCIRRAEAADIPVMVIRP